MKKEIVEIQIETTNRCHLRCLHCSSPSKIYKHNNYIFNIKNACSNSKKIFTLSFTGGEPLLNISSIGNTFNIKNIDYCALFTSGILYYNKEFHSIDTNLAKYFLDLNFKYFYISLYSHKQDIHDSITQKQGSWEYTVNSIKSLKENNINVIIHYVPMKLNFSHIENDIHFFEYIGVDKIRILPLVRTGRALANFDKIDLDICDNELIKLKNINKNISISGNPNVEPCRIFNKKHTCGAGKEILFIDIDGYIYPCASVKNKISFRLGHISDITSFDEIIDSHKPYKYCLSKIDFLEQ